MRNLTLRAKLIVSFLLIVTITGTIATIVGVRLIGNGIVQQAQEKVRLDLNSAREIYAHKFCKVEHVVAFTSIRGVIRDALLANDRPVLTEHLQEVQEKAGLDFLTITDASGRVVCRASNPSVYGDNQASDELIQRVLTERRTVAATQIIAREALENESEALADRASIQLIHTPKSRPCRDAEEASGMALKAAVPIFDNDDEFIGILYGGNVLNRDIELVDEIRDTVFQAAQYKGKNEGTATIFQGCYRIATNVVNADGERAIGTLVSAEVHERVLDNGERWVDRAFVVNDWYITAYEPIRNMAGEVIGMLYVGVLEQRFVDMKRNAILIFLTIMLAGAIFSLVVAYFLATDFVKPIKRLVAASHEVSKGNFAYRIAPTFSGELGKLEQTFNFMASALKERDLEMKEHTQRQIFQSEKLASIGRLAAGVAHQLNNPLTGVLTYSSLLLQERDADDPEREDLQIIVDETMRCREIVKNLLGFSKQNEPTKIAADVNGIIQNALSLAQNQSKIQNVEVKTTFHKHLPELTLDATQIQEAILNIVLNAIDAMPEGGTLYVTTRLLEKGQIVELRFTDTGHGIEPRYLGKVFEPFFSTKGEKGTGLGLAVAYGVVENHRGTIRMESTAGKGTTCIIELPVTS
jgi:two-component system NtrC family sensor kinase